MRAPFVPRLPFAVLCAGLGAGVPCATLTGCSAVAVRAPDAPAPSKVLLTGNSEAAWETTISTLHRFGFRTPPGGENKLAGTIETVWVVGSGLAEPWNDDSVGFANRLEDSLQSTRRRVVATVRPVAGEFGPEAYEVTVRAFKEMEDVRGVTANTTGGATFQTRDPLDRDLQAVHGQFGPTQWTPLGRDPALENAIVAELGKK